MYELDRPAPPESVKFNVLASRVALLHDIGNMLVPNPTFRMEPPPRVKLLLTTNGAIELLRAIKPPLVQRLDIHGPSVPQPWITPPPVIEPIERYSLPRE